jgi:hypothetical protein
MEKWREMERRSDGELWMGVLPDMIPQLEEEGGVAQIEGGKDLFSKAC